MIRDLAEYPDFPICCYDLSAAIDYVNCHGANPDPKEHSVTYLFACALVMRETILSFHAVMNKEEWYCGYEGELSNVITADVAFCIGEHRLRGTIRMNEDQLGELYDFIEDRSAHVNYECYMTPDFQAKTSDDFMEPLFLDV